MTEYEVKCWFKKNKKYFIIGGAVVGISVLAFIGFRNREAIELALKTAGKGLKKSKIPALPKDTIPVEPVSAPVLHELPKPELPKPEPAELLREPWAVDPHFRKLPAGWKVSAEKLNEAAALGITLPDGYTYVDAYVKGGAAA